MIEHLRKTNILGEIREYAPDNSEIMEKVNEIIDKVNELDIKLHTVKFFTTGQEEAIAKLIELNNNVGEVIPK